MATLALDDCTNLDVRAIYGGASSGDGAFDSENGGTLTTSNGRRTFAVPKGGGRAECGKNTRNPDVHTFQRFYEGQRTITGLIVRLDDGFPIDAGGFNDIAQWKQAGPVGSTPVLSLRVYKGNWQLQNTDYRPGSPGYNEQRFYNFRPAKIGEVVCFGIEMLTAVRGGPVVVNGQTVIPAECCTRFPDPDPRGCSHLRVGYYSSNGGGSVSFWRVQVDG